MEGGKGGTLPPLAPSLGSGLSEAGKEKEEGEEVEEHVQPASQPARVGESNISTSRSWMEERVMRVTSKGKERTMTALVMMSRLSFKITCRLAHIVTLPSLFHSCLNGQPQTLSPCLKIQLVKLIPSHIHLRNQCSLFQKVTLAGNHWLVSPDFVEYVEYPGLWFPHQLSVDTDGWLSQGRLASARAEIKSWEIPPSATLCVITPHSARLCQGKVVPGAEESPQGDKRSNQRCTSRTTKSGEEQTALHSI